MMEKIKLSQAVIVEGKYDKIKLSDILDAFIVETNGFQIFKDKQRLAFIKKLASERGIIILTDSDHAGFMIRNYIKSGVPEDKITNVYIPDILGKEKRKSEPSKEGKLGVEGMSAEVILKALERAGVTAEKKVNENPVTKYDLYEAGFSGTPNAKQNKKKLLEYLKLPEYLSTHSMLTYINNSMSREEFFELIKDL